MGRRRKPPEGWEMRVVGLRSQGMSNSEIMAQTWLSRKDVMKIINRRRGYIEDIQRANERRTMKEEAQANEEFCIFEAFKYLAMQTINRMMELIPKEKNLNKLLKIIALYFKYEKYMNEHMCNNRREKMIEL